MLVIHVNKFFTAKYRNIARSLSLISNQDSTTRCWIVLTMGEWILIVNKNGKLFKTFFPDALLVVGCMLA